MILFSIGEAVLSLREEIETFALKMLSRPGQTSDFRRRVIEVAGIGLDTKVIDMATAVGGMAFAAAERTHYVTAIDISKRRIDIAKADSRANNVHFYAMDATHTDFLDKAFDVALIVLGLHEMTPPGAKAALKEARRIAKKLVVVEFGLDKWPLFWIFFRYALALFEPSGFLKFTRYNVAGLIEETGWKISKEHARFPFVTYICI